MNRFLAVTVGAVLMFAVASAGGRPRVTQDSVTPAGVIADINGQPINPSSVTTQFVDAGVVSARGAGEVDIGINGTDALDALGFNTSGGLSAATYMARNKNTGNFNITMGADMALASGSGNTITLNAGSTGSVHVVGSKAVGHCTLDGATPSKCTATVLASTECNCTVISNLGTAPCTYTLSSTTVTLYSAAGLTNDVSYHCF